MRLSAGTAERELKKLKQKVLHMQLAAHEAERRLRYVVGLCEECDKLYESKGWKKNATIDKILSAALTGLKVIAQHKEYFNKGAQNLYEERKITEGWTNEL